MKTQVTISIICCALTACASTPEVAPFQTTKVTNLSITEVKDAMKSVVDSRDDILFDTMSDDLIVISSTNKDEVVACRVGFGDTFRSANSKFFFRRDESVWSVRSEHAGRAGIGSGSSDIAEFKGADIPCISTGFLEKAIFSKL